MGKSFITPSIVAQSRKAEGFNEELLKEDTISRFGSALESYAKHDGQKTEEVHHSIYKVKNTPSMEVAVSWVDEEDRSVNLLTSQIEIGTLSFIAYSPKGPTTVEQYSLFDDENGRSIHKHVWLSDPEYQMPKFPANPQSLEGKERKEYDAYLAGIIENTYRMERSVEEGYAQVGNVEANSVMARIDAPA